MTPDTRILKRKKLAKADSSSEDDKPLSLSPTKAKRSAAISMPGAVEATTTNASRANGRRASRKTKSSVESSDEDDNAPLAKPKPATNGKGKAADKARTSRRPPKKKVKQEESEPDVESEDETPPPKKAPIKRKAKAESGSDSEDDKPLKKKRAAPSKKAPASKKTKAETPDDVKPKKRSTKKEESVEASSKKTKKEEDEEIYRWWEQQADRDGSAKWETLEHNGVYFPPPYEPLPPHVKMKYNGAFASCIALWQHRHITCRRTGGPSSGVGRGRGLLWCYA